MSQTRHVRALAESFAAAAWALGALCAALASHGSTAYAQNIAREAEDAAKLLVVKVSCRDGSGASEGGGIIVGADAEQLYVVTADHVVRPCRQGAGNVSVGLRWRPNTSVPARVTPQADTVLDLAVLSVPGLKNLGITADQLPFDRLGVPDSLERASRVFSLGHSRGRSWAMNTSYDLFAEAQGSSLYYESNFIGPGMSGGALLDAELLVVGMLRSDEPPTGVAVSIASVLSRLRQWRYPVSLHSPSVPSPLATVVAGDEHMCGLDQAGTAYCWGSKKAIGVLGNGSRGIRYRRVVGNLVFRSLSAGAMHTCGITVDSSAFCWGWNLQGSLGSGASEDGLGPTGPVRVAGNLRFATLNAGVFHVCGITTAGKAYCWGDNDTGQLGDGSTREGREPIPVSLELPFADISAGNAFSCGVTTAGAAYCWGINLYNQLGNGSGDSSHRPVKVLGGLKLTSITASASGHHVCALTSGGAAFCWGRDQHGQRGNGLPPADEDRPPTAVAGGLRFKALITGTDYTCGLSVDGKAYCWGRNAEGQLGNGTSTDSNVPVAVAGDRRWSSIRARISNGNTSLTCGLTGDGPMYCWGLANAQGQVDHSFPVSRPVTSPRQIQP